MRLIKKLMKKLFPIFDINLDIIKTISIEYNLSKIFEHKISNNTLEQDVYENIVEW